MTATARRWLVPEVVQTSAMDCGPAALKCLLDGFGTAVSYGRLREACQTDVDGTSIDTLEEIAKQLGLEAEQTMIPLDHLLLVESEALPGIIVVRLPNGFTHFVVIWRKVGPLVQVMDPGMGRRWVTTARLLEEVYVHSAPVPVSVFREWASSDSFLGPFRRRLAAIGCQASAAPLIAAALEDPGWRGLAALDASTRMVASIVEAGGVRRGSEAAAILAASYERARAGEDAVPLSYWSARPDPSGDVDTVLLSGAVIVTIAGLRDPSKPRDGDAPPPLSPELVAALEEPPSRPARELLRMLRGEGWLSPATLVLTVVASVLATAVEAVLFRSFFEVGARLGLFQQRIVAIGVLVAFSIVLLALELPMVGGLLRLGRRLEVRLRIAFLSKLPRLTDRYFQSRPTSDMAERSHAVHTLRALPDIGGRIVRDVLDLAVTTLAICWIDPASAPLAALTAVLAIAVPLTSQPVLAERDLRARSHLGALGRFYLDALLGLVPVRTHGAERAVRREHEGLLVEWARASHDLVRAVVVSETVQAIAAYAVIVPLVLGYLGRAREPAAVLLLLYWALNLPAIGEELAMSIRQYPARRNTTLRLLEPLGALEDDHGSVEGPRSTEGAISIAFEKVSVVAAGHTILEDIDLHVPAGQHVAIIGASGAGKSSFVGALLGWLRPHAGQILVNGRPLDGDALASLRRDTAWVDPGVQLWNRSLLDNLRYGARDVGGPFAPLLEAADLHALLSTLPDGLQTKLGESGALVSGGEGQRVRVGRALLHPSARLAILDEPFRGLDRARRRALLQNARGWWKSATLLCVTHDVGETRDFDRVIVIDGGRVVEDGSPHELASVAGSMYRAMLDAETTLLHGLWSGDAWRGMRLDRGTLSERAAARASTEPGEQG